MDGQIRHAKALLEKLKLTHANFFWRFIFERSPGIEKHCNRRWESVSPLEFAVWAGDIYMVRMLLSFISRKHMHLAVRQMKHVLSHGTEYGRAMAPFLALLDAYDNYDVNFARRSWEQRDKFWQVQVGRAQKYLPAYGLQEMCRKIDWRSAHYPEHLPDVERDCSLANGIKLLAGNERNLGVAFGLMLRGGQVLALKRVWPPLDEARYMINTLYDVRLSQLISLVEQAEKELAAWQQEVKASVQQQVRSLEY